LKTLKSWFVITTIRKAIFIVVGKRLICENNFIYVKRVRTVL